jgi:hypothetical protein
MHSVYYVFTIGEGSRTGSWSQKLNHDYGSGSGKNCSSLRLWLRNTAPQTERVSKQWVKKDQPGPRKARVHATWTKKMVLILFDRKGVIYMNYVSKRKTVNAKYVKKALARFLKDIREKRPIMSSQEWLYWIL